MRAVHQILVSPELGGAAITALQLARFLRARGQTTHLWVPGAGPAQQQAVALGFTPHMYHADWLFHPVRGLAFAGNCLIGGALWRGGRPGIAHVHSPIYYRAMRLGLGMARLTCVVHVQISTPRDVLQWAFRIPPHLIVTCAQYLVEGIRQALPGCYQERQRIECVPNAVDVERFYPGDKAVAKRHVGAPLEKPLALMVANLAPHKGQETAIRAVAALKQARVHMVLWLAGAERGGGLEHTRHLRTLCTALGVADRVHFLGHRADTPVLLRAADVFLLPSRHEGLPLSILEAQASKVPVLATPIAGIPEVIRHEHTGLLIAADDVLAYAHHIKRLLEDTAWYQHIAEHAYRAITKDYSWQHHCERMWLLYQECAA